jgi:hypothetical protein
MDEATSIYNKWLDKLHYFADENKLPPALHLRMRQYLIHSKELVRQRYFADLLPSMSYELRREVRGWCAAASRVRHQTRAVGRSPCF